jgi:Rrf2 family protein
MSAVVWHRSFGIDLVVIEGGTNLRFQSWYLIYINTSLSTAESGCPQRFIDGFLASALFVVGAGILIQGKHVPTNKGKYGLKAMVHLAGLEPGAIAQVTEIAETNSISKKFLDHILTELRHAGLVYSKKGRGGGYALARPANEIRVGAIVRVLAGRSYPLRLSHRLPALHRLQRPKRLRGSSGHDRSAKRRR